MDGDAETLANVHDQAVQLSLSRIVGVPRQSSPKDFQGIVFANKYANQDLAAISIGSIPPGALKARVSASLGCADESHE